MADYDIAMICNEKGGSATTTTIDEMLALLHNAGYRVLKLSTTPEPGSATQLARRVVSENIPQAIAYGGDGTVCQVAEGLIGSNTHMAAYHGGTGNLFVNTFFPRLKPSRFITMVRRGMPQPIDMIRLEYTDIHGKPHNRLFMTALGLGPLSDATLISQNVKRVFGNLAYVASVAISCIGFQPIGFDITTGNGDCSRGVKFDAATVVVANVLPPHMAHISRGCNASDGMMDCAYAKANNVLHLIPTVFWARFGNPEYSQFYGRLRAEKLFIKTTKPVVPNIDGDASPATTELTLTVVPGAVKMILI